MKSSLIDALRNLHLPHVAGIIQTRVPCTKHLDENKQPADCFPSVLANLCSDSMVLKNAFSQPCPYMIGPTKVDNDAYISTLVHNNILNTIMQQTPLWSRTESDEMPSPLAKIPQQHGNAYFDRNIGQCATYTAQSECLLLKRVILPIDRDMRIIWVLIDKIVSGYWRLQYQTCFRNNVSQGGQWKLLWSKESARPSYLSRGIL